MDNPRIQPPLSATEEIAKIAHEVNRAYCEAIGDDSQPTWDDAPPWQRESACAGVRTHLANPGMTPEQSHESWYNQKLSQGWTYGETKDEVQRTHPCMRPYSELPPEQRVKDYLFSAIVSQLRGHAT